MKMGGKRGQKQATVGVNVSVHTQRTRAPFPCRGESGQSIVMISLVVMAFLLFFGLVINTGILITAKISLQTAADAAAYAGAAVQARQLNSISYLNYDMRRQYKKYLFRYVILGNFARKGFNASDAQPNGLYSFPVKDFSTSGSSGSATLVPINIPVICLPITPAGHPDDNCIIFNRPNTAAQLAATIPFGGIDLATSTYIDQMKALEAVARGSCAARGVVNRAIMFAWLFRGDVDQVSLQKFFENAITNASSNPPLSDTDRDNIVRLVSTLTDGLGIYPRNLVSSLRIHAIEKILNEPGLEDVDDAKATDLERASTAEVKERTITAFRAAYVNLNPNTFAPADIKLTEILNPKQLALDDIKVDFTTYYQDIDQDPSAVSATTGTSLSCVAKPRGFSVMGLPVGVKNVSPPNTFVHYAVKVKAKVNLLFPRLAVELEAVAGAKPFGSRIGPPNLSPIDFTETLVPGKVNTVPVTDCTISPTTCVFPNLKIATSPNTSFLSASFLSDIWSTGNTDPLHVNLQGMIDSMVLATAPNPQEVGQYNILPPPPVAGEEGSMKYEFIPYWSSESGRTKPVYRFYAPVFLSGADVAQQLDTFLDSMLPRTYVGVNAMGIAPAVLRVQVEGQLKAYINTKLPNPSVANTENAESTTFAAVELPIPKQEIKSSSQKLWLNKPNQVLSSWGPSFVRTAPGQYTEKPRFGYSVKFVTMQNLIQQGMLDTDGDLSKVSH